MDAKIYLKDYAAKADKFLNYYFRNEKKLASKVGGEITEILKTFQNYVSGGKKIRGALTVLGYQLAGGKNFKAILPVSCGIELLHSFLLIHDDIIDKDKIRRGKPTVHEIYSKGRSEHYGTSKAIMVGDIGAFLGYNLITTSDFPKEKITKALSGLNSFLVKTAYGEILDVDYDFKKSISWKDILKVRIYKTAYYTFVMPLSLGAVLGGANASVLKAIESYGLDVGVAFQIADDILGVFGDPEVTGKSNESDIREGKKTFLFAKAQELAKSKDKKFLAMWYGSDKLDRKKIDKIREIMISSGSLEFSKKTAKKLIEKGKRFIPKMTKDKKLQELLTSLADLVISREK